MRAAFYYGWYPEHWREGHRYMPVMGEYDSTIATVITAHIQQMKYAQIEAGLWSWWGVGSPTDLRFRQALNIALERGFKWAILYELDQDGREPSFNLRQRIDYLRPTYFNHPAYLHVNGKPVVFVYNPGSSVLGAGKWARIRKDENLYVALADYPQWWTGAPVDAWFGYRPSERLYSVRNGDRLYAVSVSAGFWSSAEATPRLVRDYQAFCDAALAAEHAGADWTLYYYNEHGEGTAIEPSDACCNLYLCSDYLAAMRVP